MTIVTNFKQLAGRIETIRGSSAKLRDAIQAVLPGVIFHAYEHGDVTLATRLLDATKGVERQAIVVYLEQFGPFILREGEFRLNKAKAKAEKFDAEFFESEECPKWYEFVKDAKALNSTFDLEQRVNGLLKSMQNARDKGDKEVLHEDLAEYLRTALIKYHSDKALAMARKPAEQVMRADGEVSAEELQKMNEGIAGDEAAERAAANRDALAELQRAKLETTVA